MIFEKHPVPRKKFCVSTNIFGNHDGLCTETCILYGDVTHLNTSHIIIFIITLISCIMLHTTNPLSAHLTPASCAGALVLRHLPVRGSEHPLRQGPHARGRAGRHQVPLHP